MYSVLLQVYFPVQRIFARILENFRNLSRVSSGWHRASSSLYFLGLGSILASALMSREISGLCRPKTVGYKKLASSGFFDHVQICCQGGIIFTEKLSGPHFMNLFAITYQLDTEAFNERIVPHN